MYRKENDPMKLNVLLRISAIHMALLGLGFLFAPARLLGVQF